MGRKRVCLVARGNVDQLRASELFLRELRAGLIGRISLEAPGADMEEGSRDS